MAIIYWEGDVSGDPKTAGNYAGGSIPTTGDTLVFNDQATAACTGGDISTADSGVNISVVVEKSHPFAVGVSGTPFASSGFTYLNYAGSGIATSYFAIGGTGALDFDDVILDTDAQLGEALNVDGTVVNWTGRAGKGTLDSGATISGRAQVMGSGGRVPSELTIPNGVTTTGLILAIDGGKCSIGATVPEVQLNSGEAVLTGSAGITGGVAQLTQTGGQFWWDAASTITLAEIHGGSFATRISRTARTMTAMRMYGEAEVDFSVGGTYTTFTNGIKVFGSRRPKMASGMTYSFAF